jgi:tetratricopeptide (TPR) repeat protein
LHTDPIGKTNGANIKYEIHPFVERDQPTLARPSTVSGLDKLSVSRYWHQLNNIGTIKKSEEKPLSSTKLKSGDPSFPQISLEASLQPSDQNHKVSAPTSPRSMVQSSSINGSTRRPSTSGIHSVPSEDGSREYSAFLKVTKQIAQIAKSSAVDFQLNRLMDVDFSHRRINQGEKDMLTRAANLEKDGDVESAIVCYKRAGIHSKDKQLSKLLLGNLSFRQEKFLAALGYYDYALKILLSKAVKVPHDEFLAYYNRSIIHFRLGNDEEGVKDIEKAVSINPSSIEAREILAIARRRTGKYLQAVDEAAMLKIQRQEKERMERLQSQQAATAADESIFSSREGSPQRGRRSDISIRAAASKKQGVSFEQSQLSSKIDSGPSVTTYGANSYALQGFQAQQSQRVFNPACGGVQVRIDEPTARTSFLEKIVDHRKANKSEDAGHEDGGGALKIFKMNNGYELELFDDLFKKPSSLQYALITPPSDRTIDQHNIIRDTLKTFPFLRKMSPSSIQELAGVVEYRALTGKGELFVQNEESAVTCLLLNGHVQVKMDASYGSTMMDVILGELKANSSFAYIDLLFRKPRPQLRSALEEALFPLFVKQSKQIASTTSTNVEQEAESADEKSVNSADTEEEGDLAKFSKEFEEFWQSTPQSRSIAPGMFMTYTMQSACEFLMIPEHEYNRVMMNHALEELKARIGALISCGIFKDWHLEDLIRLARMSQIKFYNGGETILQQGTKPSGIGIVMKGLCKVIKKPNRTEMLYQKLNVALEKADQYDLKYVYHHGVSKGMLVSKTSTDKRTKSNKSRAKSPVQKSKHHHTQRQDPIAVLKNFPTNVYCEPMPATEPETFRKELQAEIEKLQQLIQKAKLQDAMDWREDRTTNTHGKSSNTYDLVKSDHPSKVNELAGYLSGSIAEIATLQWPMLFGEACILDPENGISRGSVAADTACEILVVHKVQIQTFPVDADFLDRVRGKGAVAKFFSIYSIQVMSIQFLGKAIAYPHDPDLVVNLYRDIEWKHYKEEMMQGISTTRWPKKFDTHEPFII